MSLAKKSTILLQTFVHYLSMFSPRSKNVYVFGAWMGQQFSDNPKYLYLEACKDKRLTAVWVTKNNDVYTILKASGYKVYLDTSISGIYYQLRASIYFTCMSREDVLSIVLGRATRINLWHGVGLKKILNDDKITKKEHTSHSDSIRKRIWEKIFFLPRGKQYIVSTSDTMTEIFANAFQKSKDIILQLGQPRNDVFFREDLEFESFDLKGAAKKIILYMPTHRKEGKEKMCMSEILDFELLNQFCVENDALFLVKKHYYHSRETETLNKYDRIKDITRTAYDSQQLLKYADVLITDYSSCYVDFLLLDRPVLFYNYDYETYILNDRDLYFDYDATTPGEKAKSFPQLLAALQNIVLGSTDSFIEQRRVVKNIFYAADNQNVVGKKILAYVRKHF